MALGKGLGAILEEVGQAYENELAGQQEKRAESLGEQIVELPVDLIDPNPYQPRKEFDAAKLEELGESIRRHGLLQPVVVIPHGERYLLVAGERRLRAHKLIGETDIRAIVADVDLDRLRMRELALVENIQRENLNPVELAHAYQELLTVHGITHEELASIVHKSRSQITNTVRILSLSEYVQERLVEQKITQGHAKILLGLSEEEQKIVVDSVVGRKLSVRETEELVKAKKKGAGKGTSVKGGEGEHVVIPAETRETIGRLLPFEHRIRKRSVEIRFGSEGELEKFLAFLRDRKR